MAKTTQDSTRIREAVRYFQGCNGSAFSSKSMEKEALHHGKTLNGLASSSTFQKVQPPDKCKTCPSNDSEHSETKGKKPEFKSVIHVTQSKNGEQSKDIINSSDCLKTENSATVSTTRETGKTDKEVVLKEDIKNEVLNEKVNSSGTTEDSCSSFEQESRTEDEMVVMRKASKSKEDDKGSTSETDDKDLTQTLGTPLDKVEDMTPKRGTCKVVSDAFNFLKDGVEGGNSIVRDSGIPQGGGEDKIFNRLLTLDEGMENHKDTQNDNSSNNSTINGTATDGCSNQNSPANKRKMKRQRNASVSSAENSEDSEDEDTGIYNESFRKSVWLCVPEEKGPSELQSSSIAEENETDEVFLRGVESTLNRSHKRTDSTNTTHSESEFKHEYHLRRKCMVHRHDSQQEYHRMSAKVYEHEKLVVIVKEEHDKDFGLHIFESHPAIITDVDTGSPAYRAGLRAGQILLSVNGSNALELSHQEIIQLIQKDSTMVKLEVASSAEVHHIRNQQTPVFSGFMCKQSNSTFVKNWRRRFFVLRFDNCLYYYKTEQDQDPLGAIPLLNYIVSKQTDSSKEHCFKAEKFGARTYYFIADSREDMIKWISTLNEAATRAKEKKDAWMDVTACNVGLPALDIKKPDCFGYLSKCGRTVKAWKKRYCVLKDACIYYYKNVNSANAQGMAHLHGYKVEPITSTLRRHGFLLRPPESQMRTFSFTAENETDQKRWMSALEKSIQRWIKVD